MAPFTSSVVRVNGAAFTNNKSQTVPFSPFPPHLRALAFHLFYLHSPLYELSSAGLLIWETNGFSELYFESVCVSVCVCLFVCIHPYILCWYIHPWICICVCVWVGGCMCVFYPLSSERKSTFSWSSVFFFFLSNITLPRFSLSTSLYLLTSLSLPPPSSCVPQFFIPSLIIYHHYSTTTWYDKYQTWVVYRYSICFLSQRLLTEAFSLTWIARWGTDFSHNWI